MVIDAPGCSNPRFPSSVPTRPTFGFAPALTSDNNNVFGISSLPDTKIIPAIRFFMDTQRKPGTGSKLDPYSPTREQDNAENLIQSISAMPAYKTKSQEELRWEDYELLPNNKCCGSKNCDTLRSQIDTLHSQFETLRSEFEMFKPKNILFGPKNNLAVSPFHQTQEPNKNSFGPNSTPFLPSSLFSQSQAFNTTNEPFKPNNNPFGPNSTSFPTPSLFSQPQALNTTNEPFKPNNNLFCTTDNNTSPTPNIFALNKHHQTQPFELPGRRLEPNSATCGANDEVFHSISVMPGYEAKSHEELRWENYKSLPNNKCK